MVVTVGNKQYVIEGVLLGGQVPAWKFIKYEGKPITGEQFAKLPEPEKLALTNYVQQHLKNKQRR